MPILKAPLFTGQSNADLEDCAGNHIFNFYKGKPSNTARFEAINRIREALKRLGFPTTDPAGVYGDDTARAVQAYKGPPRNILGPGQTRPDNVVGRGTIVQLDKDLMAAGLGAELVIPPAPKPEPTGFTRWFSHLVTFDSHNTYLLTLQSIDQLQYAHFRFEPRRITNMIGNIAGSTRENTATTGVLRTTEKVELDDLTGADCDLRLQSFDHFYSGKIHGYFSLTTIKGITGQANVPPYGTASGTPGRGSWQLTGKLFGPIDWGQSDSSAAVTAHHFARANHKTLRA